MTVSKYPILPLAEALAAAETALDFERAGHDALAFFDELNRSNITAPLDCRAGCSFCCSLRVDLFAHEVFVLAWHIRAQFSPPALSALLARLAEHASQVLPLTPFAHVTQNIPCPLLIDGCCSVYAARPHSCRRHHSRDVTACQYTFDHPTDLEFPGAHDVPLFRLLSEAMQRNIEVYAHFEYDHTIYELGTALEEALTDPECWTRWLNREPAFLRASRTPSPEDPS